MKKATTNFGHSVRTRLLAVANERRVQLEYVLLRYAFERFLYRLGRSAYANRFVLKGASAFAVWVGPFCRVTRDADLEAFGDVSAETLLMAFKEAPQVRVYPRYTVVAEKFQVMVARGLLNSRLKDYYDLWLLSERFDFDRGILRTAVERTFARRGTVIPHVLPDALTVAFSGNHMKRSQWRAFLRKTGVEFVELPMVIERLAGFLAPVLNDDESVAVWRQPLKKWCKEVL